MSFDRNTPHPPENLSFIGVTGSAAISLDRQDLFARPRVFGEQADFGFVEPVKFHQIVNGGLQLIERVETGLRLR